MAQRGETLEAYIEAARWVNGVVASIADDAWTDHALGDWDLRALVGHTGRALSTVRHALAHPAQLEELTSSTGYFLAAATAPAAGAAQVRERGGAAGLGLGEHPGEAFHDLTSATIDELAAQSADADPLVTSVAGGIRLSAYLPTRIVELVVHGLDVCRAIERDDPAPLSAQRIALRLLADLAADRDRGPELLLALTGREP